MKAVISNRIYVGINAISGAELKEALTYFIPEAYGDQEEIIKNYKLVNDKIIAIPSGRLDLIPEGYEVIDRRVLVPAVFPEFRFTLRPSQQQVLDETDDSCLINAKVSWGKTFTALKIAQKLGQKTLIVTHTVFLRDQWVDEIKKVFGITPGLIGGGKVDLSGPIVVGNLQTLRNVIPKVDRAFGTVIVDECHRVPSATFSLLIDSMYARYKIGLSGTLTRKDHRHVILPDFFAPTVHRPPAENYMVPRVDIINTPIKLPGDGATPWAVRVNKLIENPQYLELITILAAAYAKQGHKVLVLGDRVSFLQKCYKACKERALIVTGSTDNDVRSNLNNMLKDYDIIFGTQSIFSEGISINSLSCLILGTPVNNDPLLTQLIGRVIREAPGKATPVIVDINLKSITGIHQARARLSHYMLEGYSTRVINQ